MVCGAGAAGVTVPAARVVAGVAAGAMAAAQLVLPLSRRRVALSSVVVGGLATASTALAADGWGARRAAATAAAVTGGTLALEAVAWRTGLPFGRYRYTGALRPHVAGVPALVPLAWLGMGLPARAVAARLAPPGAARVAVGAAALTAWDVALDPQMVREGFWAWAAPGRWRGIPLGNYAGWLAASAVLVAGVERLLPDPGGAGGAATAGLLALYTWMGGLEAFGFAFVFGDPLVGVATALAMLPAAVAAWRARTAARAAGPAVGAGGALAGRGAAPVAGG